jgi:hypothetical protein
MTIAEAIAVNTILRRLVGETAVNVEAAGVCLLKRANALLITGMRPEEWSEKWRKREAEGYRRVVQATRSNSDPLDCKGIDPKSGTGKTTRAK